MIHSVPSDISEAQRSCHQNKQLAGRCFILCHDCKAMVMSKGCPHKSFVIGIDTGWSGFLTVSSVIWHCVLPGHHFCSRRASWRCGFHKDPVHHLPAPGECLRVSQNNNKCLYLGKRLFITLLQANRITEQTHSYLMITEVAESDPDIFCYLHPMGWICAKYV